MAFQKEEKPSQKEDDFNLVGWVGRTGKGKVVTVKDDENNLLGFVHVGTLKKLLEGKIKGAPIKTPKEK